MRTIRIRNLMGVVVLVTLIFSVFSVSPTYGQSHVIGPFSLPAHGSEQKFEFGNVVPPNPEFKEFEFSGQATNDYTVAGSLYISFDYYDANGQLVMIQPPTVIEIPANTQNFPVAATARLEFCPDTVSIHFKSGECSIMDIEGTFTHTCYGGAVPTLTEWGLIIFGVVLLGFITYVFLRRRKAVGVRV